MTRGAIGAEQAAELLRSFSALHVVVIGDVFLDRYVVGRAERLSREGPVPVLAFRRRFALPGGGANPAWNIARLGAGARQVGVVGADEAGGELVQALEAAGIETQGVVVDASRPTTEKTRIVAEGLSIPQQVARVDEQCREALDEATEAAVVDAVRQASGGAHAILVSHYRSGVVTDGVCDAARSVAAERGALLTADAQGDLERFHGFDLLRIGRRDAAESLGASLETDEAIHEALLSVRERLGARVIVLGRGSEGMSLLDDSGYAVLRPVNVSEVFDVTGAGDTVIAVMTLALAAGATGRAAAALANFAAGIVVRRLGVAAPTAEEIVAEIGARA